MLLGRPPRGLTSPSPDRAPERRARPPDAPRADGPRHGDRRADDWLAAGLVPRLADWPWPQPRRE